GFRAESVVEALAESRLVESRLIESRAAFLTESAFAESAADFLVVSTGGIGGRTSVSCAAPALPSTATRKNPHQIRSRRIPACIDAHARARERHRRRTLSRVDPTVAMR